VKGSKAVFDVFNTSVEKGEEGLIIKQLDAPYIPNDRSNHWLKMKSDYFEGMADTLDLVIVGGYFGRSNWASG